MNSKATALLLATFAMSLVFTWTVGFLQFAVGLANNAVVSVQNLFRGSRSSSSLLWNSG